MRKIILILFFVIILLIFNIILYIFSDDYKWLIKSLKSWWLPNKSEQILDTNNNEDILEKDTITNNTSIKNKIKNSDEEKIVEKQDKIIEQIVEEKLEIKQVIVEEKLDKVYKQILDIFSTFNLNKLELHSNLFDITDEYPDKYDEYYWENLTLYFFNTKQFGDIYDIFKVLEDELPYSINQVDNFGEKSFYINLDTDIQDNFIRLVISYKSKVFWIKIKQQDYKLIKIKLQNLKF